MFKTTKYRIALLALLLGASNVHAELNVFACEPELAALSTAIGGHQVKVFSATRAGQDPHHIQARPSLIAKARQADLLVCTGAELEVGWLPLLLRKSSNGKIQPGQPGHFLATDHVELVGVGAKLDRSHGDVHASGNPHAHLSPLNLISMADALAGTLAQLDSENQSYYKTQLSQFHSEMQAAIGRWRQSTAALAGKGAVVHHDSWPYLLNWLGIKKIATLEPKPGVSPSSGHLSRLVQKLKKQPAHVIIYSDYQSPKAAQWLAKQTGLPAVALPFTVEKGETLISWMDRLLNKLLTTVNG